jgi:hypothetical protein
LVENFIRQSPISTFRVQALACLIVDESRTLNVSIALGAQASCLLPSREKEAGTDACAPRATFPLCFVNLAPFGSFGMALRIR